MERALIEYAANALWQVPLLAAGAWLLLRMVRLGPAAQHWVWLAVLGLALALPLYGAIGTARAGSAPARSVAEGTQTGPLSFDALDAVGEPGGIVLGLQDPGVPSWSGKNWSGQTAGGFSWRLPVHVRRVRMNATAAHWIAELYLALMLFGLFRIAWAWHVARRLVKGSRETALPDRESGVVADCARRLGVRVPQMRESSEISGPVVVGAIAPVLLWPENFASHSEDERMAALCHEMAHIRRHDYLVNLLCEAAASPLKWHPAIYGVQRRIRGTREMACDAMAAEAMQSETVYAKCLLSLAQSMVAAGGMAEQAQVPGLFNGNVLEERVMRLIQNRTAMSARARMIRGAIGATAMTATIALAAVFHVAPTMAQTNAGTAEAQPVVAQSAPVVEQAAPVVVETQPVVVAPAPPAVAPIAADPASLPAVPPLPVPPVQPAPVADPVPPAVAQGAERVCDSKPYVFVDGQMRELTPAERQKVERQLAEAQQKIAEATAKINSPEFRKQIEDAQKQALAALNNPEFQKKMADAQKQIAAATAWINSPQFKQQMEDAGREAAEAERKLNSGAFQKQMADAQKQLADALAKMKAEEDGAQTK